MSLSPLVDAHADGAMDGAGATVRALINGDAVAGRPARASPMRTVCCPGHRTDGLVAVVAAGLDGLVKSTVTLEFALTSTWRVWVTFLSPSRQ